MGLPVYSVIYSRQHVLVSRNTHFLAVSLTTPCINISGYIICTLSLTTSIHGNKLLEVVAVCFHCWRYCLSWSAGPCVLYVFYVYHGTAVCTSVTKIPYLTLNPNPACLVLVWTNRLLANSILGSSIIASHATFVCVCMQTCCPLLYYCWEISACRSCMGYILLFCDNVINSAHLITHTTSKPAGTSSSDRVTVSRPGMTSSKTLPYRQSLSPSPKKRYIVESNTCIFVNMSLLWFIFDMVQVQLHGTCMYTMS